MAENEHENVEFGNLALSTGFQSDNLHVTVKDDVLIIVTQAFGPKGGQLVGFSNVLFDGYPAVTVKVEYGEGKDTLVHLSPFHGDRRKKGGEDIPAGTRCKIFCPVSGEPLKYVGAVDGASGSEGARYFAVYLTPDLSKGEMVAISDIWGDYNSRIIDNNELVSAWASRESE